MAILAIGVNHKTASVEMREKIYFPADKITLYLQDLVNATTVREAILYSTCNRSELYCEADDLTGAYEWFYAQTKLSRDIFDQVIYVHEDVAAIQHMMHVACGLDSMVLGEPQILGQIKEAFSESCAAGAIGSLFHRLFQQLFAVAKDIRATTAIGACPVSVASAAIHFLKQVLTHFGQSQLVIVGAGDTTALLMRYLKAHLEKPVIVVNRHLERAMQLTNAYGGVAYEIDQLEQVLVKADIVISATSSPTPLIHQHLIQAVMTHKAKAALPDSLYLMDLAVPRDIDLEIKHILGVKLYGIDDLKEIIEQNKQGREHAAQKAREMIQSKSIALMQDLQADAKVNHAIRTYRQQIEAICEAELNKAKQQLSQGMAPEIVLQNFARTYTQKLLHIPSVQLRQAGAEGQFELLQFAKQLFAIKDPETDLS